MTAFAVRIDAAATALAAGLRYVDDTIPGYERRRWGRGFSYRDWKGATVRDRSLRAYFESLAIPPAWEGVWICRYKDGHLLATGRDDAGRKQYLYHPGWRDARDQAKYRRMVGFGNALPALRKKVSADLKRDDLARECVLASVVRLLETSLARVGNDEYARDNDSYGLTTIRKRHVELGKIPILEFVGKGGKIWTIEVDDPAVAKTVRRCVEVPGWELFKFIDESGEKRDVTADHVNEYLRGISGIDITAKDFRTWAGTVLAWKELRDADPDEASRDPVVLAVEAVAEELGNTPAVSRASYIHPGVIEGYEAGDLEDRKRSRRAGLDGDEASLLAYLEEVELSESA